jgi:hypothetical protein
MKNTDKLWSISKKSPEVGVTALYITNYRKVPIPSSIGFELLFDVFSYAL